MTHETKADIYDRFKDYVENHMKDDDNPQLELDEFDKRKDNQTHMEIMLLNVVEGKKELHDLTSKFNERAFLKTKEILKTGSTGYYVYLPFKGIEKKKVKFNSSSCDQQPNTLLPVFYMFCMMCLLILAVVKTSREDWRFLF